MHELPPILERLAYTEKELQSLLGISDTPLLIPHDIASYLRRCQQANSPLALMACLWFLMVKVYREQLEELLGPALVAELEQAEMLEPAGDAVKARGNLYPCQGLYVFTDQHLDQQYKENHVYELGTDSYVLARVTPRQAGIEALDLCTGSGLHALLAARHHERVVGVDLNPRALKFSRLNARVNGLEERCQFLQGDLYQPVQGQSFDLITANPPFVPTPDPKMQLHRTGGETGEEVSQRLVEGLPTHLKVGGTFSMVLDYPVFKHDPYLDRLVRWLGGDRQGWGVAVLLFAADSREEYIKAHLDSSDPEHYLENYTEYLRTYERLQIEEIGFANVFIRRLPPDHPGFAVYRSMAAPKVEIAGEIDHWLQALSLVTQARPEWDQLKPRLAPRVEALWMTHKKDRGMVELVPQSHSKPIACQGLTVKLATRLNGRKTVTQLIERWPQGGQDLLERLRWLIENLLVEFQT